MRKASLGIITERTDAGNATRNNMCKGFLGKDDLIGNHEVTLVGGFDPFEKY